MQINIKIILNRIVLSLIMERRWKIRNASKLVSVNLRGLKKKRIHLKILRNININMCFLIRNQWSNKKRKNRLLLKKFLLMISDSKGIKINSRNPGEVVKRVVRKRAKVNINLKNKVNRNFNQLFQKFYKKTTINIKNPHKSHNPEIKTQHCTHPNLNLYLIANLLSCYNKINFC